MSTSLKNVFYPTAIAFVLVLMLGTTAALAGDNGWTYSGLVGSVADIVTDPVNPDIIYVLMNNGDAGQPEPQPDSIMKSTDGGSTWVEIGGGWGDIYQIAIAHDSSNILYAATAAGLYLTQDGGLSWRLVYADFETFAGRGIACRLERDVPEPLLHWRPALQREYAYGQAAKNH